jgi:hypothetical protein
MTATIINDKPLYILDESIFSAQDIFDDLINDYDINRDFDVDDDRYFNLDDNSDSNYDGIMLFNGILLF